ncbi:hypothetical protein [Azospirillum soli]|uniref:hypothetical protein n=1 Tax=Azospirillum soli TaxID=1304799 RepID=UPI001AE9A074|nr:hypothetical protein [Azospirillum soli]MBP2311912.1 hypothetical protein [Azospirillum soli]
MPQPRIYGTENSDTLTIGGRGTSIVYGLAGNDSISGTNFELDVLFGGDGMDYIFGGTGDYVIGGAGDDTLYGTYVTGGAGNDRISNAVVLQYSGPQSAYSITWVPEIEYHSSRNYTSGYWSIADTRPGSPDGTDRVYSYSAITFSDTSDFPTSTTTVPESQQTNVYRFYNTQTLTHFYTNNLAEVDFIRQNLPTFNYEGARFQVPISADVADAKPMYRFYNTVSQSHFFTFDENERDYLISNLPDFKFEGIGMYGYTNNAVDGAQELYRFYNEATSRHFFTTSEVERDFVLDSLPSYRFEGIAGWVFG